MDNQNWNFKKIDIKMNYILFLIVWLLDCTTKFDVEKRDLSYNQRTTYNKFPHFTEISTDRNHDYGKVSLFLCSYHFVDINNVSCVFYHITENSQKELSSTIFLKILIKFTMNFEQAGLGCLALKNFIHVNLWCIVYT